MKSLAIISLFLTCHISSISACSCIGEDSFCATIQTQPELTILRGKKLSEFAHGMDFEVTEVIRGEETNAVVRIWGDVGHLCRLYVSAFAEGEELILALTKHKEFSTYWGNEEWMELEQIGDYEISFCGVHFVQLSNSNQVAKAKNCLGEVVSNCLFPKLKIFPLPADNDLFIATGDLLNDMQEGEITLYNIGGKKVSYWSDIQSIKQGTTLKLKVAKLAAGIYFLKVNVLGICSETRVEKVIIK